MTLKSIGGAGLVLGLLVFLLALAQPATVPDSTTTCVESSYFGRDCSTVSYERPNYGRTRLIGGASSLVFGGLCAYGIGIARSSGSDKGWSSNLKGGSATTDSASSADSRQRAAPRTLREQLEERKAGSESADAGVPDQQVVGDSITHDSIGNPEPTGHDVNERSKIENSGSTVMLNVDMEHLVAAVATTASALGSAFVLSWLLSVVTVVESVALRTMIFILFSIPGVLTYRTYAARRADTNAEPGEVTN